MKKLLIVCGPTATGKTALALRLAGKFNGELVSADSRQVYKHMNIGTGKDIPDDFWVETSTIPFQGKKVVYYTNGHTRIWGYDLVHPKEEFSVAQYSDVAHAIIAHIHSEGKLPILVGGTGLYIKSVTDGIATSVVPKNYKLREGLQSLSVEELQSKLNSLDSAKLEGMNASDRANPRRLVRAIEVASLSEVPVSSKTPSYDCLFIGLALKKENLDIQINARVESRMKRMKEEIISLMEKGVSWSAQAMSSIGYKEWGEYFKGGRALSDIAKAWKRSEEKYAKRQKIWFKRDERINWFDVSVEGFAGKIEKLVRKWHNT